MTTDRTNGGDEEVLSSIYATIRSPSTWPSLLEKIGSWLDADSALMMTPALPGVPPVPLFAYGIDVSLILDAYPKYAGRAEFTHRAMATGAVPGAFLLDELITPAEQSTSAFWRDMIQPLNVGSGIFGMVRTPDEGERPIILNFYRKPDKVAFARADVEKFLTLFPHLRRALAIVLDGPPPAPKESGAPDAFAAIGAPVFLFDAQGLVIYHNHGAELLLAARDGLSLRGDRVLLWDEAANTAFNAALGRVKGDDWSAKFRTGVELLARRPSGGAALVLSLVPIGASNPIAALAAPVRCAVFVLEEKLRANGVLPERLRRLYGLTAAEIEVGIAFAQGQTLAEISAVRGTAVGTVRGQIKTVMAKTESRRQTDVAALINRLRY